MHYQKTKGDISSNFQDLTLKSLMTRRACFSSKEKWHSQVIECLQLSESIVCCRKADVIVL